MQLEHHRSKRRPSGSGLGFSESNSATGVDGRLPENGFAPQCHRDRARIVIWGACLVLGMIGIGTASDKDQRGSTVQISDQAGLQKVQLRGKVVCLPEEMHRIFEIDLPTNHEHIYGFKTTNGVYYTLLRTKLSEALFADGRFREKELLLTGKVLPKSQIFNVTAMKSIRDGVVYDLYYYCDICAIKTVVPGPCMCCQAPVELVEEPMDLKSR
jgi:hypothetical protein